MQNQAFSDHYNRCTNNISEASSNHCNYCSKNTLEAFSSSTSQVWTPSRFTPSPPQSHRQVSNSPPRFTPSPAQKHIFAPGWRVSKMVEDMSHVVADW
jgi:hypothetical protein